MLSQVGLSGAALRFDQKSVERIAAFLLAVPILKNGHSPPPIPNTVKGQSLE